MRSCFTPNAFNMRIHPIVSNKNILPELAYICAHSGSTGAPPGTASHSPGEEGRQEGWASVVPGVGPLALRTIGS